MALTAEQIEKFKQDGFLVLPKFFSDSQMDGLKQEVGVLLDNFDMSTHPRTLFSTQDHKHASDEYFLASGDKISYFFEEDVFDANGELKVPKHESVHKIGHAMHELNPVFREFCYQDKIRDLSKSLMPDPVMLQTMYIFKAARIGGPATPHQDSTFLYTNPTSHLLGLWVAVEDADEGNGCLWGAPGSHKPGLSRRFLRNATTDGARDDRVGTKFVGEPYQVYRDDEYVPLVAPKGTLILLDGCVIHKSLANTSPRSRHAFTIHLFDAAARYPSGNWLQSEIGFNGWNGTTFRGNTDEPTAPFVAGPQ